MYSQNVLSFTNFGTPTSRPMSLATNVSVELGGYQVALEEVLTWLLEAEDKLNHAPDPGSSLEVLKQQFHEHETFLMELSGHQDGVGAVLEEGARLLAEGGLHKDEEHEVRVQMSLLNSRWEGLRMRAMERQTKIHEVRYVCVNTRKRIVLESVSVLLPFFLFRLFVIGNCSSTIAGSYANAARPVRRTPAMVNKNRR